MSTATKPLLSGHCGTADQHADPRAAHARCRMTDCSCRCHDPAITGCEDDAELLDDLPEAEYHADTEALSASGAKLLLKAPALFKWHRDHPTTSDTLDLGKAAHARVLGVGADVVVVDAPDWRTKAAKDARDAARAAGKAAILTRDELRISDMADVLAGHAFAMELLAPGRAELSLYATDERTGVRRRGRLDWMRDDGVISDYKTTVCAEPAAFARGSIAKYGYHVSEAQYRWLAERCAIRVPACAFIVQEKEPPYLVEVVELDQAAVDRGAQLMERALDIYADCMASDRWPGYTTRTFTTVSLPEWALRDDSDDYLEDEIA